MGLEDGSDGGTDGQEVERRVEILVQLLDAMESEPPSVSGEPSKKVSMVYDIVEEAGLTFSVSNPGRPHPVQADEGSRTNVATLGLIPTIWCLGSNRNGQCA